MNYANEILHAMGREGILVQMAEECGELTQACMKMIRSWHGQTPVSEAEARDMLIEECADVELMIDLIHNTIFSPEDERKSMDMYSEKYGRCLKRFGIEP